MSMTIRSSTTRLPMLRATSIPTGWRTSGACLKRGLHGTYVSVEPFHLFRYLDEQAWRFNHRKEMKDADRFSKVLTQVVGKRVTYDELTGKVGETTIN